MPSASVPWLRILSPPPASEGAHDTGLGVKSWRLWQLQRTNGPGHDYILQTFGRHGTPSGTARRATSAPRRQRQRRRRSRSRSRRNRAAIPSPTAYGWRRTPGPSGRTRRGSSRGSPALRTSSGRPCDVDVGFGDRRADCRNRSPWRRPDKILRLRLRMTGVAAPGTAGLAALGAAGFAALGMRGSRRIRDDGMKKAKLRRVYHRRFKSRDITENGCLVPDRSSDLSRLEHAAVPCRVSYGQVFRPVLLDTPPYRAITDTNGRERTTDALTH